MEAIIAWVKYWFAKILELIASHEAWKEYFGLVDDTTTTTM